MKKQTESSIMELIAGETQAGQSAPCIGRIAGVDARGRILVSYGKDLCHPARLVAPLTRYELMADSRRGAEVLLIFEQGDENKPVIVALMADPLDELAGLAVEKEEKPPDAQAGGRALAFESEDEILLKCGPGSIRLTKDGQIILKGIKIVTRAKETCKIRGGKVEAN